MYVYLHAWFITRAGRCSTRYRTRQPASSPVRRRVAKIAWLRPQAWTKMGGRPGACCCLVRYLPKCSQIFLFEHFITIIYVSYPMLCQTRNEFRECIVLSQIILLNCQLRAMRNQRSLILVYF